MLKKIAKAPARPTSGRFAIVAAKYNNRFTDALVQFARTELGGPKNLTVIRVPGAFEIPAVAARLARSAKYDAVICFGAVLRGATTHADHIVIGVTNALAQLQIDTGVPIVHGVLLFENENQARERCLEADSNRGTEAARTALEMAAVMRRIGA